MIPTRPPRFGTRLTGPTRGTGRFKAPSGAGSATGWPGCPAGGIPIRTTARSTTTASRSPARSGGTGPTAGGPEESSFEPRPGNQDYSFFGARLRFVPDRAASTRRRVGRGPNYFGSREGCFVATRRPSPTSPSLLKDRSRPTPRPAPTLADQFGPRWLPDQLGDVGGRSTL